ncbi:Pumilio domain-containing protein C6G9.14 [Diplonema papillatum]|nr:Pumilio domain-containing protein C6G9.14 [Diplonema papillatum]
MSDVSSESSWQAGASAPHTVSIIDTETCCTCTLPCDVVRLTTADIHAFASEQLSLVEGSFDLHLNGRLLQAGNAVGNGSVIIAQTKAPNALSQNGVSAQWSVMPHALPSAPVGACFSGGFLDLPAPAAAPANFAWMLPDAFPAQPAWAGASSPPAVLLAGQSALAACPLSLANLTADIELCAYACTADGSRGLCAALQLLPDACDTVEQLLSLLSARLPAFAAHQHASKVVMCLVDLASRDQLLSLTRQACSQLPELAESGGGADIFEALMEAADAEDPELRGDDGVPLAATAVAASLKALCFMVNGRKALLAVLRKYPPVELAAVFGVACGEMVSLSTDQCGCIAMQRMYDHCDGAAKELMQKHILDCLGDLVTDPYGNYVLQHASKDDPAFSAALARSLGTDLPRYAGNKYSSNVIEGCLQCAEPEARDQLIRRICSSGTLRELINDAYGNYVVQSAVEHVPAGLLDYVKDRVLPLTGKSPFGHRIYTRLQRRLRKAAKQAGGASSAASSPPKPKKRSPLREIRGPKCNAGAPLSPTKRKGAVRNGPASP